MEAAKRLTPPAQAAEMAAESWRAGAGPVWRAEAGRPRGGTLQRREAKQEERECMRGGMCRGYASHLGWPSTGGLGHVTALHRLTEAPPANLKRETSVSLPLRARSPFYDSGCYV